MKAIWNYVKNSYDFEGDEAEQRKALRQGPKYYGLKYFAEIVAIREIKQRNNLAGYIFGYRDAQFVALIL